ncbi:uncharacterized protein K452DRAFT_294491 [Aplosporella prunicola CBS 121167]|uniref:Heterokaryon incompatibility domain-containing protein n=1 Tax=Aplosporella prunicola CBS 121167 TaxID=1176127 RepID=A0A6A6BUF6_9PEZI|nr:uncharacterized protein K452DRAFT_294491 [Aplosporella prunicola CBS 121167]KAF2146973.1 hypothetical protein K452DRAFT_294491 [Aplosporella prunicola CBS 121167]
MAAMFAIEALCWNQFIMSNDYDCEYTGLYKILDGKTWIGSVHLTHTTATDIIARPEVPFEFIVLSKTGGEREPINVSVKPHDDDAANILLCSADLLETSSWDVYNVMLVRWEQGTAYRRRIGQIHKASFDAADWSMKDIRLG